MDRRRDNRLPELDQGRLGQLPTVKRGQVISLTHAPWPEPMSRAASVLLQISGEQEQWHPILASSSDLGLWRWEWYTTDERQFWTGLLGLEQQRHVEIILSGGLKYILIRPSLVEQALHSETIVGHQPAISHQPTQLSDNEAYPFWR